MPSRVSKVLELILRSLHIKDSFNRIFDTRKFGKGDMNEPPKSIMRGITIDKTITPHGNVFTIKPLKEIGDNQVLYLHGGGYIHGFNRLHWLFLKTIALFFECTIVAPDYPLAPEFTYHDSFEMVIPIYKQMISKVGIDKLVLMGDSSGGGFALALAQKMAMENQKIASDIILISPWLDITLENKDIVVIEKQDPILGVEGLRRAGMAYAGESSPDNFMLSPINGNLEGLGKISIFIGTKDILVADNRKLHGLLDEKKLLHNYFEYDGMLHVWPLFNLPESKQSLDQMKQIIDS